MRRRDIDQLLRSKDKEIIWLRGRVTELEDRLMVMADKPWTLPPAEMVETPKDEAENDDGWVNDPSQLLEAADAYTPQSMYDDAVANFAE